MTLLKLAVGALSLGATLIALPVCAQDNAALLNALIRKGVLTAQEAEDIRADVARESHTPPVHVMAGGKSTERLSVGMRLQLQYANLDTDVHGLTFASAATDHFFLRRMYLSLKAAISAHWGATMTYDIAAAGYDEALIEWKPTPNLSFDFGLRKVNVANEERGSSGDLRSIERSGVTRYFVDANNGRRLGAASFRVGVFMDGKHELSPTYGLVYSAAITDPERNETITLSSSSGDSTNNHVAFWGNVGVTGKLAHNASWIAGVGAGFLPDQGGAGVANLGRGFDLTIYSVYGSLVAGRFRLLGEYLTADVERGASATRDARPEGFFIQPSLYLTDTFELVTRYQWLDSDHRGVTLADVIRSAPAGPVMNKFTEWYAGGNVYLRGNDLKLQLGAIYGKTRETLSGPPADAKTVGVRSQMQLQF